MWEVRLGDTLRVLVESMLPRSSPADEGLLITVDLRMSIVHTLCVLTSSECSLMH